MSIVSCPFFYTWSVPKQSQNSYRLLHRKQEAIRTIPRREISEKEVIFVRLLFDFVKITDFHQNGYIHPRTLHAKKIHFTIKTGYSITTVHTDYTNKEFKRNYKKFQKV
jgi:hypothetical protein